MRVYWGIEGDFKDCTVIPASVPRWKVISLSRIGAALCPTSARIYECCQWSFLMDEVIDKRKGRTFSWLDRPWTRVTRDIGQNRIFLECGNTCERYQDYRVLLIEMKRYMRNFLGMRALYQIVSISDNDFTYQGSAYLINWKKMSRGKFQRASLRFVIGISVGNNFSWDLFDYCNRKSSAYIFSLIRAIVAINFLWN